MTHIKNRLRQTVVPNAKGLTCKLARKGVKNQAFLLTQHCVDIDIIRGRPSTAIPLEHLHMCIDFVALFNWTKT